MKSLQHLSVSLRNFRGYDWRVHPHGELVLADYEYLAHTVRLMGFFCMRNISMHSHVMAELWRDTFECASYLDYWSANPLQLCHPNYLAVIGRASKLSLGAH